ncbi:hypothetical protein Fmac_024066 [Flemingia macrophylla]|uniref:Polycomb protein VEFS-Box domain-containing protein n=1 Tax=Flemingia macrophylla TaxID=520843 RepID=A0ABD1LNU3_9FABA
MSHDLLNFEFSELSGTPSVQVSIKGDWRREIVGDIDPKIHIQNFCAKRRMRRDKPLVEPEIAAGDTELLEKHDGSNAIILRPGPDCAPTESYQDHETAAGLEVDQEGFSKAIILHPGPACVPPVFDQDHGRPALPQAVQEGVSNAIILHPGPDHCLPPIPPCDRGTPAVRQVGKRSRLLIEHHDEKMVAKLRKRKFYHSHKYQPMELEEVLRDEDSEDEINEHAQEIQDRMKIARLDATDDAKQFITQWNLFVKKHRVLADGHINWAFEAFTKFHCADIAPSPILSWRWKELAIKLSNHGLLKPQTVLASKNLLEEYRKMNPDISQQLNKFQI